MVLDADPWSQSIVTGVSVRTRNVRRHTQPSTTPLMICVVWAMAQSSRAIVPKDPGGPFGQRIGVSVTGNLNWALRVGAYVTGRTSSQPQRYSIVVLNCRYFHGFQSWSYTWMCTRGWWRVNNLGSCSSDDNDLISWYAGKLFAWTQSLTTSLIFFSFFQGNGHFPCWDYDSMVVCVVPTGKQVHHRTLQ